MKNRHVSCNPLILIDDGRVQKLAQLVTPTRARLYFSFFIACVLCAFSISNVAFAATGASRQALTTSVLRVCADPANLPFSSEDGSGLENRIIELLYCIICCVELKVKLLEKRQILI